MVIHLPEYVENVLGRLTRAGYRAYAVGGCVRDSLLNREPNDWDICTSALPEETQALFAEERTIPTGIKHGTVTLLVGGNPLEITTFRTEDEYSDFRHPDEVRFVRDIREDLARRDFTVNAMAYNPIDGLVDDFGGQKDLENGIIRCVGAPEIRFTEDALRVLRALRFAARYGFSIEEKTAQAMRNCKALLQNISVERIFSEIKGILAGKYAAEMLRQFPDVFFSVLPELEPMFGFEQNKPSRHLHDVWLHTVYALEASDPDIIVRLAVLLHDCGKPQTYSIDPETGYGRFYGHPKAGGALADAMLRRLKCDNATREAVVILIENHEMLSGHSKTALRRLLSKIGKENMLRLMKVRRADAASHTENTRRELLVMADEDERILQELLDSEGQLTVKDLAVNGRDLQSVGFVPGRAIGEELDVLLNQVIDGRLPNDRTALLKFSAERKDKETSCQ